ncbi:hypothetical protein QJS10_CPA09g01756 [Acorus calamus]|uniref:Rubisco accumulation factor 1, chloroplastic n=1 Tax=Acorus calamus TaxID=4465 RepID=A0AAV9E5B2_ACOCL|nr:hypothetical protein QJS10_CPA09g01756 [Acorus calamus]
MFSLITPSKLIPPFQTPSSSPRPNPHRMRTISTAQRTPPPPPPPGGEVYQPFRPPPSPLPSQYRSLGPADRLEILRNRLGLWHEYAPLIPALTMDGFTPPSIEEATGISGVEQNRIVVAAKVRESLISSKFDDNLIAYFDLGGAEILYELRLLSAAQRVAVARHVVDHRLDTKAAVELARAMKDFPRRRGDPGWSSFSAASPSDCLAFTHYRLSREAISPSDGVASLERALEAAETEAAKEQVREELERRSRRGVAAAKEEEVVEESYRVPVVRLMYGEVAEATAVLVMPVCSGEEEVAAAPENCKSEGVFGVVEAEKGWRRWVVLPLWEPVAAAAVGGGVVVVEFADSRVMPWRMRTAEMEERVMAVVDRKVKVAEAEDGFYLIGGGDDGLRVERGKRLVGVGVLGRVVLVVRPPRDDDLNDQLADEDWD